MPITQGAGNPTWSWDETLLALDLLYRHDDPIYKGHEDVEELSRVLRSALIHPVEGRRPSFRNADGVALKLQNLLSAIDPSRGLSSSATDRKIVKEYPRSKSREVAALAAMIRSAIARGEQAESLPDDELFVEGQFLTAQHRRRDSRLRKKLLASKGENALVCEACDFKPPALERPLQESFFEAHHIRPLAEVKGTTATRVKDLALLCAGCHRFIHKAISTEKRWISIEEAREILSTHG